MDIPIMVMIMSEMTVAQNCILSSDIISEFQNYMRPWDLRNSANWINFFPFRKKIINTCRLNWPRFPG